MIAMDIQVASTGRSAAALAAATPYIDIRSVAKTYETDSGNVQALSPMSLEIRQGEFISLLGPSGCGKTTLMMILAGLASPSQGEVRIGGNRIEGPYTDLGIVFQNAELLEWRTALQNVLLQIEIRKLDTARYLPVARKLLEQVGLKDFEGRFPDELSGGMKQRVALCRALVHDPDILLLDEPFGALDAMTRDQMNADLQRLWLEKRKTAILVTHSIDEAVFLSDRVLVMSARPARVVEDITIDLPRPRSLDIRHTAEFNAYTGRIWSLFKELGIFTNG
jgi:NitT/TauT family transport system ATP-binding protein